MLVTEDNYLAHYGILRRSGRYPWGSGGTENVRNKAFLDYFEGMKKKGLTEAEICKGVGITTTEYRAAKSIAKTQQKQSMIDQAERLRTKGMGASEIGRRLNLPESTVRNYLAPGARDKSDILKQTTNLLRSAVLEKKYVDVGTGVETQLGISKEKLATAVAMLKEEGYTTHSVNERQPGTGLDTKFKVLVPPGVTQHELFMNKDKIQQITEYSTDGGRTYSKVHPPIKVALKRIQVRYKEDGGATADGVIYVRPGVEDLSLGGANYAQVRVQAGNGHYLKGMAMYKEGLPEGVDLVYNVNKSNTGNKTDALKKLTDDPQMPFGTTIRRQILKNPGTSKEKVTSALNIVNEEGNWATWSKSLSAQFLSKQNPALAQKQLDTNYERKASELKQLNSLTNPTIKKKLLESFADSTDSSAVHLDAAALPGQNWHAILPLDSIKPTEIYAPNYKNGTRVVLVRYPHGGTFEIPELTVNNKQAEGKKLLGTNASAVVGIHHTVAERLSGADFDGDTVLVIPNDSKQIKTTPALEGLKTFDPKHAYPPYHGMKTIDGGTWNSSTNSVDYGGKLPNGARMQQEMGNISNLITDMTIKGAPHSDIAPAVRHSMVIIDSQKHSLDFKASAEANGIKKLKEEYQRGASSGADTLISRATSAQYVNDRKLRRASQGGPIDSQGRKVWEPTNKLKTDGTPKQIKSKKLAETNDAHTLSSGTKIETIYADHSNRLKALANQARLDAARTPSLQRSPSAAKTYAPEVASLKEKLKVAYTNRPYERQALIIANANIRARKADNPTLSREQLKKISYQALEEARIRTGANKKERQVVITPKEWDAIQSGAISNAMLKEILTNTNVDQIREYATPRTDTKMTPTATSRAMSMLESGYTRSEVAQQLGVSLSTLDRATNG